MATNIVGVIQTLTVTGAAVGDYCLASFSVDLTGMTLLAWVSATNTVKFQFQNKTAGTLDLASGTVRVGCGNNERTRSIPPSAGAGRDGAAPHYRDAACAYQAASLRTKTGPTPSRAAP